MIVQPLEIQRDLFFSYTKQQSRPFSFLSFSFALCPRFTSTVFGRVISYLTFSRNMSFFLSVRRNGRWVVVMRPFLSLYSYEPRGVAVLTRRAHIHTVVVSRCSVTNEFPSYSSSYFFSLYIGDFLKYMIQLYIYTARCQCEIPFPQGLFIEYIYSNA